MYRTAYTYRHRVSYTPYTFARRQGRHRHSVYRDLPESYAIPTTSNAPLNRIEPDPTVKSAPKFTYNVLYPGNRKRNGPVFVSTDMHSPEYKGAHSLYTDDSNQVVDPRDAANTDEPKRTQIPVGNLNQTERPLQVSHSMPSAHEPGLSHLKKPNTLPKTYKLEQPEMLKTE